MPLHLPTPLHEHACHDVLDFFAPQPAVDSVLVVRSCARGTAVPASDLDMAVLARSDSTAEERDRLRRDWESFRADNPAILALCASNQFAAMHLEFFDGRFSPTVWDDNGGPDDFEFQLGNFLAYSAPVGTVGPYLAELLATWLPYYDEQLRAERLAMARRACVADIDCVPFYLDRSQHFQAFDRLYKAFKEYLQALLISGRVYPLGYDRWVREQVVDLLGRADLYPQLPPILQVESIDSRSMMSNAARLRTLVEDIAP